MDSKAEEVLYLLPENDSTHNDRFSMQGYQPKRSRFGKYWTFLFGLALIISLTTNLVLVFHTFNNKVSEQSTETTCEALDTSLYAHLPREPNVPFPRSTGYGPGIGNDTYLDELWESIDIDPGVIAVPNDYAEIHNLPPTQRFPWDESKGIYTITAFHVLHCLKIIHRYVYDSHHNLTASRPYSHVTHCLDAIREDTLCNADDYLLSTPPGVYGSTGPRGQTRQCRDWDKLTNWAKKYNACYKHITDDAHTFDEIERYKFCPEESPYISRMEELGGAKTSHDQEVQPLRPGYIS